MHAPQRKNNYASLTIEEAILRLLTAVETIELRRSIKSHEKSKVEDAFRLIDQPISIQPASSKADERRENYRRFLKKIKDDCGSEAVIVCAIGLGQTAIGNMKEYNRLRLPLEIKKHEESLKTDVLRELAEEYGGQDAPPKHFGNAMGNRTEEVQPATLGPTSEAPAIPPPEQPFLSQFRRSRTSREIEQAPREEERVPARVFILTHQDARDIVESNQIEGEVWMTDPFDSASTPFITVPVSDETVLWLSERRRIQASAHFKILFPY